MTIVEKPEQELTQDRTWELVVRNGMMPKAAETLSKPGEVSGSLRTIEELDFIVVWSTEVLTATDAAADRLGVIEPTDSWTNDIVMNTLSWLE